MKTKKVSKKISNFAIIESEWQRKMREDSLLPEEEAQLSQARIRIEAEEQILEKVEKLEKRVEKLEKATKSSVRNQDAIVQAIRLLESNGYTIVRDW